MKSMKKLLTGRRDSLISFGIVILAYVIIQIMISTGNISSSLKGQLVPICAYIVMAVSLNLTVGFLGELSLGHAGFMSVGAYSGALFLTHTELPQLPAILIALLIGGSAAAVFGLIIGVPVLRLKGDYLAIVTLGFGEIIKSIINFMTPITGGAKGLSKIPLYTTYRNFTFVFILTVIVVLLVSNIVRSRHGRAITSIRDNYIAAEAAGIPVSRYKIMTFVIAAFFAGVAGVVYAGNIGILKPVNFDYNTSIEILVMVVLGGMGNIKGSIIAAVILTALPEVLRGAADYRMLLYSIVLIALMLFNNSPIKRAFMDRRNMRQAGRLQKEGE